MSTDTDFWSPSLEDLARRLTSRDLGRPLRVGIDGVCGSGKTTVSRRLAELVQLAGRPAVLIDSDGFHHVRARRRRRHDDPARGYYEDAYDLDSLARRVLEPMGRPGPAVHPRRIHDLDSDAVIDDEHGVAPADAVVLFAATFIQRDGLRDLWDEVVFLDVDEQVALQRGIARDADALGGVEAARAAYESRYMAACRLYLAEQDPRGRASVVLRAAGSTPEA